MTWPTVPLEAKCETCGRRHGSPMCPPVRRPLSEKPLCKHGERDPDELPHTVYNEIRRTWTTCPAVPG